MEEITAILDHTMYYQAEGGLLVHLRDGSAVINHSLNFNSQMISNPENDFQKLYCVTTRDIKAGEEMYEDYGNYVKMSQNWAEDIFRKYVPSRLDFEKDHEIKKTTVY